MSAEINKNSSAAEDPWQTRDVTDWATSRAVITSTLRDSRFIIASVYRAACDQLDSEAGTVPPSDILILRPTHIPRQINAMQGPQANTIIAETFRGAAHRLSGKIVLSYVLQPTGQHDHAFYDIARGPLPAPDELLQGPAGMARAAALDNKPHEPWSNVADYPVGFGFIGVGGAAATIDDARLQKQVQRDHTHPLHAGYIDVQAGVQVKYGLSVETLYANLLPARSSANRFATIAIDENTGEPYL